MVERRAVSSTPSGSVAWPTHGRRFSSQIGISADAGGGLLASVGAWLSVTFLKPPKPKAPEPEEPEQRPLTEEEQVKQARMLDPTERKIGIVAAGLAFFISFGLTVPYMIDRHLTTR